jgi:hypothetical protein
VAAYPERVKTPGGEIAPRNFALRAVMAIAEDERIRGDSVFQRWLLLGPSRLAFWRTISSGRVKVRLRLRDGLLTRLNIWHRHQDWA